MNLWQRVRNSIVRGLGRLAELASVQIRIDDSRGWEQMSGSGPVDQDWAEKSEDLSDSLEAWRKNFLIRQVVRLNTAYVVGDGIRIFSKNLQVEEFIRSFCDHPENKLESRMPALCDELTRAGEIFPVLFTNRFDGMSQIRIVPASQIEEVVTDPEDYEKETGYLEIIPGQIERKPWKSKRTARVPARSVGRDGVDRTHRPEPMMLHYCVSKPVGATRGESDLTPILPWAKRYSDWLKDRVRFNKLRTESTAIVIKVDDDSQLDAKQKHYDAHPPRGGAIVVIGPSETVTYPSTNIQGYDAEPDGRAIRLALSAGSNRPIHFFGEGATATRSTAQEMGDPTHRDFRMRQQDFIAILIDLVEQAWRRYEQVMGLDPLDDLQIGAEAPDISRADNKAMADAAKTIVETFKVMKEMGWITDEIAVRLSFKFAGEVLTEDEITNILNSGDKQDAESNDKSNGNRNLDSITINAPTI